MKLFRLKGKHSDPEPDKELVLDTGSDDASAPEAQSPPGPEPAPAAPEEAVAETASSEVEKPASEDNFLAEISAEADKEVAEEEEQAAGAPSEDDDGLDPGLLDIFKDAKTEVEESSLAADLENIPAQEVLEEIRVISHRLEIPSGGLGRKREEPAGQPEGEPREREMEAAQPQGEASAVQTEEGPSAEVADEEASPTQTH